MSKRRAKQVREPVQVYLDEADRDLLHTLTERTGLSKAELLRRGLRQFAAHSLADRAPGSSLDALAGLIPDGPPDLSERHDEYLAQAIEETKGAGTGPR